MKYDERTCQFNMDTGCMELILQDGEEFPLTAPGLRMRWL